MKIKLKEVTVRELTDGYVDNDDDGVVGYGGRLNIRPPYQRSFVYKDKQRDAVIDTVKNDYPLNVMYWSDMGHDKYEIIDGQQRTISICQYVKSIFSINDTYFHSLRDDDKKPILNYKLMIYVCTGGEGEKLRWFKIVNIAGETLSNQELRNASYHGTWVTDAKRYFSRKGCPAYRIGANYLNGQVNRQHYLETAITWINDGKIEKYMSKNQKKEDAKELWSHFETVIKWVKATFPKYRKPMKGADWGGLYKKHKDDKLDAEALEEKVTRLMADDEVKDKKGIYTYVLDGHERHLNLRSFTDSEKTTAYEKQQGICQKCKKHFELNEVEADHIKPWSKGGKTILENCQILCRECNRRKSDR